MTAMLSPPKFTVANCVDLALTETVARNIGVRLSDLRCKLVLEESYYLHNCRNLNLHPKAKDESLDEKQLKSLYDRRMRDKRFGGRVVYDTIKTSCKHCQYCLEKTVESLDHFLPRDSDPLLSITPVNLVPSCQACNQNKGDDHAGDTRGRYIHPYFESLLECGWLKATVQPNEHNEPILHFFVGSVADADLRIKLTNQFSKLGLAKLYSTERAWDLAELSHDLVRFFKSSGTKGVREELQFRLDSSRATSRLSRIAMLEALVASDWYCSEGFKNYV